MIIRTSWLESPALAALLTLLFFYAQFSPLRFQEEQLVEFSLEQPLSQHGCQFSDLDLHSTSLGQYFCPSLQRLRCCCSVPIYPSTLNSSLWTALAALMIIASFIDFLPHLPESSMKGEIPHSLYFIERSLYKYINEADCNKMIKLCNLPNQTIIRITKHNGVRKAEKSNGRVIPRNPLISVLSQGTVQRKRKEGKGGNTSR